MSRGKRGGVISGFHSKIEKDVFHYLLKGTQPIILALARGMRKRLEPKLQDALDANRLLIISPFGEEIKRVTKDTAFERNRIMLELADELLIACASKGGSLERLIDSADGKLLAFMEG